MAGTQACEKHAVLSDGYAGHDSKPCRP